MISTHLSQSTSQALIRLIGGHKAGQLSVHFHATGDNKQLVSAHKNGNEASWEVGRDEFETIKSELLAQAGREKRFEFQISSDGPAYRIQVDEGPAKGGYRDFAVLGLSISPASL